MCDGELLEAFVPLARDTDVFVAAASKVGQTWLLALLHHLHTGGLDPDFGGRGAMAVTPWLELPRNPSTGVVYDRGERLAAFEAIPDPRVFKMHVTWEEIPRPAGVGKVITITRDPRDVPWSMHQHLLGMKSLMGQGWTDPGFDAWFDTWVASSPFFPIVRSLWPHRNDPDVLWLRYEDLKVDLAGAARRCVEHLGWSVDDAALARAVALSDLGAMQRSETKMPMGAWKDGHRFIREGAVGKNRARLSPEQQQKVIDRARAEFEPACVEFVFSQGL